MESINNNIQTDKIQQSQIVQGANNSVIILNQNGERIEFPQKLNPINTDIIPAQYKIRDEISSISDNFDKGNKTLVLLNGEGGIGKTTLAAKYIDDNKSKYKHYAWINAQFDIKDAMLNLYYDLNIKKEDIPVDKQIEVLCRVLNSLSAQKECLLILDNANNEKQLREFKKQFGSLDWQVLITSRCNELRFDTDFTTLRIEHLPEDKAKELFCDFYNEKTSEFDTQLDVLLKNIAYNTLLIHLFGKYMKRCNRMRKGKYTLKQLNADFQEKNIFNTDDKKTITHSLDEKTVNQILEELYKLSELSETEAETLFLFAFLPLKAISFEHLHIFTKDKITEDQLEENLFSLYYAGWLQKTEDENQTSFKINSPVILALRCEKTNPYKFLIFC